MRNKSTEKDIPLHLKWEKLYIMENIAKKKFKKSADSLFATVKKHNIYNRIKKRKLSFRILIFLFCFLWFIIATLLIPPLPFGNFILILWFIALFPIDKVKSKMYYIVNRLRLKWFLVKWLEWKHKIRKKKTEVKES